MNTTTQMKAQDPTADEMLAFLLSQPCRSEDDRDDALIAIYWFAADWHGGQSSNLYSALSTSPYSPGPCMTKGKEGETVRDMVCDLEEKFAGRDYSNPNPQGLAMTCGPVYMLWNGGSYEAADHFDREYIEEFATLADALADFDSRPDDSYYPCVSRALTEEGGPSAWICYTDPFQVGDLYPDATLQFNERGTATVTSA